MSLLRILLPLASLSIALVACSGQIAPVLVSPDGGAGDASPSPTDAGGQDASSCLPDETLRYSAPGCGTNAIGVCTRGERLCFEEFCSCNGKTVTGCGSANEPFAYKGACVDSGPDPDTCTPAGGSCGPISDCARGQGQLGGTSYSCGVGAPGTNTCCFKPGTPCGDAADFDCCRASGGSSRPVCQFASGTLACLSGTMGPIGSCI